MDSPEFYTLWILHTAPLAVDITKVEQIWIYLYNWNNPGHAFHTLKMTWLMTSALYRNDICGNVFHLTPRVMWSSEVKVSQDWLFLATLQQQLFQKPFPTFESPWVPQMSPDVP